MSDSNFYIMLVNSPWAGPELTPIEEADIKTNRGVLCDPGKYALNFFGSPIKTHVLIAV